MRTHAILGLFLLLFAKVRAESPPDPDLDPRPFNAVGLELSRPCLTVRRAAEKYSLLIDAGFEISGEYGFRMGKADVGSGRAGSGKFDARFRYHWLRIGRSVNLHLATGLESAWDVFLGTGLSINKQIEDHVFLFLDSDIAFVKSKYDATEISYEVFSNERIRFGLLMGF